MVLGKPVSTGFKDVSGFWMVENHNAFNKKIPLDPLKFSLLHKLSTVHRIKHFRGKKKEKKKNTRH